MSSSIPQLTEYRLFDGDQEDYEKKASQELRNNRIKLIAVSIFSIATPLLVDAVAIGIASTFTATPIALAAAGALGAIAGLVHLLGIANICLAYSYQNYLKQETLDQAHAVLAKFDETKITKEYALTVDAFVLRKNGLITENRFHILRDRHIYQRLTIKMISIFRCYLRELHSKNFTRAIDYHKEFQDFHDERKSIVSQLIGGGAISEDRRDEYNGFSYS